MSVLKHPAVIALIVAAGTVIAAYITRSGNDSDKPSVVQQQMDDSPGGIQAGGDVNINPPRPVAIVDPDGRITSLEDFDDYEMTARFEYFTRPDDGQQIPQYVLTFTGKIPTRVEVTSADGYQVRREKENERQYRFTCSKGGFGNPSTKCELTVRAQ